ncbi:TetR family transcriptional regulator [Ornithinimicrobium pratense]|uniref:TetR/AcrR family transcriptional regulator n=1 Tax=Ornithinimicrobium pratense TaxID=2593973 RepID=A0A5J6V9A1_9MICO|nr:TetR family transcriptional regulator [Ornithinimicrobium pratense]QFG69703.1 TetR/AcrR family transcriptional regulator [Ornithinimicrobium pratense]
MPTPRHGDGAERILMTALDLFGRQGVSATSLKTIAEAAGVSPALIVHHYGSKDALRVACDQHAARVLRTVKTSTLTQGSRPDPVSMMTQLSEHRPVTRYLAKTLTDGSPHVNELIDEMVADAECYTQAGVEAGLIRPSENPRARVVVLFLWSMGVLVLHEHLERLLDVSLLEGPDLPKPYLQAVLEIYAEGVLADGTYEELRRYAADHDEPDGSESEE